LLIGGPMQAITQLRGNHDLLMLEHSAEAVPQSRKARIAVAIFAAIVLLRRSRRVPIVVAAISGAVLMLLTGCLSFLQAAARSTGRSSCWWDPRWRSPPRLKSPAGRA
jgi:di/tricarboxylate transporter